MYIDEKHTKIHICSGPKIAHMLFTDIFLNYQVSRHNHKHITKMLFGFLLFIYFGKGGRCVIKHNMSGLMENDDKKNLKRSLEI